MVAAAVQAAFGAFRDEFDDANDRRERLIKVQVTRVTYRRAMNTAAQRRRRAT
jgi:hypothetical protein